MKKQYNRPAPIVIRPKKRHAGLKNDLTELAHRKKDNLNNYTEKILVRHVIRQFQPDQTDGE